MHSSRVYKGIRGEGVFRAATIGALALLCLFFIGILASLFTYTDWGTMAKTLFSREIFLAIRLSVTTATIATFFAVLIGIPAAYAISQTEFPGKSVVDTILDLPIVVSPVALGAALLVFFNNPVGMGIEKYFLRFVFEVPGIVLAQFTVVSALSVRLMKSTFDSIDPRYEQVGRTLGCSKVSVFFRVTLPLARNGLIASCILTWARAVGEFGATITLAGAMKPKTETLPVAIFLSLSTADIEKAIAVIITLVTIAACSLLVLRKIGKKGYPA